MAEAFKIEEIEEKVILVGVSEQDGDDAEDSVAELAELVKTAGATCSRNHDPEAGAHSSGDLYRFWKGGGVKAACGGTGRNRHCV